MNVPNLTGIFDSHRPPSRDLADDCVHCGFCLPSCPTYVLWGQEADSPRGRIYLMKAGLDCRAEWNDAYQRHFDTCLGCMACLTACPSGVKYDRLIEATRPQVERHGERSTGDRLFREVIFSVFPHPDRLRALAAPLRLYQQTGLQRRVRASGLMKLVPDRIAAMEPLMPPLPARGATRELPERIPAQGEARRRVGLLLGCVQRVFFSHVNAATARVLAAEGCEIVAPREQRCCGALMLHAGRERDPADAARNTAGVFERAGGDNLLEPDAAGALRDRKVANILRTGADVVASGNPGCMMQIASGLDLAQHAIPSLHLIEIVDKSIRGEALRIEPEEG